MSLFQVNCAIWNEVGVTFTVRLHSKKETVSSIKDHQIFVTFINKPPQKTMKTYQIVIVTLLAFYSVACVLSSCDGKGNKSETQDGEKSITVVSVMQLAFEGMTMIPDSLQDSVTMTTISVLKGLNESLSAAMVCGSSSTKMMYSFEDCCPCDSTSRSTEFASDLCCPCPEMEVVSLISCSEWNTTIYIDDMPLEAKEEGGVELFSIGQIGEGTHSMRISGSFVENPIQLSATLQGGRLKINPGGK